MKKEYLYFLLFFTLFSFEIFAEKIVLNYEPSVVELSGTLDLQTFPGPPNYCCINQGDDIERGYYLKLSQVVDVLPKAVDATHGSEIEHGVKIMQLVVMEDSTWEDLRKIGKRGKVKIKGTLFHRWTGHHHSRVLLIVKKLQEIK